LIDQGRGSRYNAYAIGSNTLRIAMSSPPNLTVVDLFCGAGGLGLGFRDQGFKIIWAADAFTPAVNTYRKNIGDHIEEVKLDWNTELPLSDIIAGGPPCQGFSSAGLRKPGDTRNTLVAVYSHCFFKPLNT